MRFDSKNFFFIFIIPFILLLANCKDNCDGIECKNGGACRDGKCECQPGFTGEFCQQIDTVATCKSYPCQHGYTTIISGSCACVCDTGYFGVHCDQVDLCVTDSIICLNGGICDQATGSCNCPTGYEGASCQTLVNAKFIGSYLVAEDCDSSSQTVTYGSSVNAGLTGERIFISNLHQQSISITARVTGLTLLVDEHDFGILHINGGNGTYYPQTNKFTLVYNFTTPDGNSHQCSAEFVRQ